MDCQMPLAAPFAADSVSSDRCAEASYPVIVYCVSSAPSGRTYHQKAPWWKPELLMVSVNTKFALWCFEGPKMRISTMIEAPNTCHHTEMLLIQPRISVRNRFADVTTTISTRNQKNCWCR